jgi:phosphoribosylformylglycinamidine synthase
VLDLARERALQQLLVRAAGAGLVESAHDCSEGGVAVALAESSFDSGGIGFSADLSGIVLNGPARVAATLFGESASRVVASVQKEHRHALLALAASIGVPARVIGETGGTRMTFSVDGRRVVECTVAEAEHAWSNAISDYFVRRDATSVA